MPDFAIGSYVYFASENKDYYALSVAAPSDPDDRVKRFDCTLHQRLSRAFRERCLSGSQQIKDFLRTLENTADQNFTIKLQILENEPVLSAHFSKEELGKIPLLWIAVLAGYMDSAAELLVRSGADVNQLFGSRDPQVIDEKSTVLHLLLQVDPSPDNQRLVRLAVDHGADLQARDSQGRTALHFAVTKDLVQMVEMLLEKGADLQARDFRGQTALHYAVTEGLVQITDMLLKKGAEVNVADHNDVTPLLEAVSSSKADELAPLLMSHGADIFVKDKRGQNVLYRLSHAPVEHVELARCFIEKGVSLHDRDYSTLFQPIHRATIAGHNELLKLYLDHGADVNARAYDDISPLHLAARSHRPIVLTTLLKRGANSDQRTILEGCTALHHACLNFRVENMKILLSAGADVLAETYYDGQTPFAFIDNEHMTNFSSIRLMINPLALKKVCQPSIELKDESIIEQHTKLRNYYHDCIEQLERTKFTRIIKTCTFFDLLTKCHCHIAALMRNLKFEIKFNNGLSEFPMYAEDLSRPFKRARNHHQSMLEQEDVISEAVDGILPYLIVRRVAHYILNCCDVVQRVQ